MKKNLSISALILLCVAAGMWLVGSGTATGQMPGGPAGPMPVSVMTLVAEPIQQWHEFSGNLVPVDRVEIRPRVGGSIDKIYFTPGGTVEKGDKLFLIDPRPYQAEVNRAAADLAVAKTEADLARTEAERAERLIAENAIAQRAYDERKNAAAVTAARVKAAHAALNQAQLNLGYATITAPVRGKISRAEITVGNLVEPGVSLLATLVSMDPIYADFDIDEQTYLAHIRSAGDDSAVPVELSLKNDASVHVTGKIVSFDNKLNPETGTLRARAVFGNADGLFVPGMFATVRLGSAVKTDSILVPEAIIGTDQDKRFLYVVDGQNMVQYAPVRLGGMVGGKRVILEGVKTGDRVVVNGLQRLRPGMPVAPQEEKKKTAAQPLQPIDTVKPE